MSKRTIATANAPAAIGPYSQAVVANGFVFCSGQIALHPTSGVMVGAGDVRAEARRAMQNLAAVLEAAGANVGAIVKTTIFLADMADFAAVNEVYASFFTTAPPARATVAVSGLPKGARVEIDAVAVVSA